MTEKNDQPVPHYTQFPQVTKDSSSVLEITNEVKISSDGVSSKPKLVILRPKPVLITLKSSSAKRAAYLQAAKELNTNLSEVMRSALEKLLFKAAEQRKGEPQ